MTTRLLKIIKQKEIVASHYRLRAEGTWHLLKNIIVASIIPIIDGDDHHGPHQYTATRKTIIMVISTISLPTLKKKPSPRLYSSLPPPPARTRVQGFLKAASQNVICNYDQKSVESVLSRQNTLSYHVREPDKIGLVFFISS